MTRVSSARYLRLSCLWLWLAVVCVASSCGSEGSSESDDDESDDTGDPSIGEPTRVTVTFVTEAGPKVGALVAFQGVDGTLIDVVATNDEGVAEGTAEIGGMVTYQESEGVLRTTGGLHADDFITVGPAVEPTQTWLDAFVVEMPASPPVGTTYHQVSLGCNAIVFPSIGTLYPIAPESRCLGAENEVAVYALALSDSTPLAYAYLDAVPYASEARVSLPPWSTSWADLSLTAVDLPSGDPEVSIAVAGLRRSLTFVVASGSSDTLAIRLPQFIDELQTRISLAHHDAEGGEVTRRQGVLQRSRTLESSAVSLASLLPIPSEIALGVDDAARPVVRWVAEPHAQDVYTVVRLRWAASLEATGEWLVRIPVDHGPQFQFPELPEDLAGAGPAGGAFLRPSIHRWGGDSISWDEVRRAGAQPPELSQGDVLLWSSNESR